MLENNTTEEPLISILMGIYNCEDTLETAAKCIIDQTYSKWELIMCDDCSTDGTLKIARKLAKQDQRIKVIKNEKNLTLAPTLNHCLSIAKGKYVARMDGDDICALDRLEKELHFLERHEEYSLVSCNMDLFDQKGVYRTIFYIAKPSKHDFVKTSPFCHAGCMMRTDIMRKLGGYSESLYRRRVEDYDLWVRMYFEGFEGYNLQETLYAMRDDRNALYRRTWRNRINEMIVKFEACRKLKLPPISYGWIFVPIIKWMVPSFVYKIIHKKNVQAS